MAAKCVDFFFGVDHCKNSIEWDEIKTQFKIWK